MRRQEGSPTHVVAVLDADSDQGSIPCASTRLKGRPNRDGLSVFPCGEGEREVSSQPILTLISSTADENAVEIAVLIA